MTQVILDAVLRSKLHDLKQALELCDESGKVLARLVPVPDPAAVEPAEPQLGAEALQQRREEPELSTAEVLGHLDVIQEHERNEAAFRRLKPLLAQTYPPGRFVAIAEGRVVADADRLDLLRSQLQASGKDPARVLVVQAGADYPESAVIFLQGASV